MPPSDETPSSDFAPPADDPLRRAPSVDDMEARRARSAIEGRLFSGPAQPIRVGRYRITGRIGAGGMGVVYRAHDPELARDVAVKVMHPDAASGRDEKTVRARLVREARAMARLAHPNVIHVYDVGTLDDGVFIAMELVHGESLAGWQAEHERDWRSVLAVCLDAGRGLAAAHAAGVVHRDFKPENVLVGEDGRARVGDFGLAGGAVPSTGSHALPDALDRTDLGTTDSNDDPSTSGTLDDEGGRAVMATLGSLSSQDGSDDSELDQAAISGALTRTGMLLGTPKYMAPEQEIGGTPSPLADQFSFCVALYEALYGQPPYAGDSVRQYRKAVHEERWLPPPSDTKVKAWVYAQVTRGLAVDPLDRHESVEALIERLEAALSDPSRARRRRRRRRVVWLSALGVLALGTGVASAFAIGASDDDPMATTADATLSVDTADSRVAVREQSPPSASIPPPSTTAIPASDTDATVTSPEGTPPSTAPEGTEPVAVNDAAIPAVTDPTTPPVHKVKPASPRPAHKAAKKSNDRRSCYFERDNKQLIASQRRKVRFLEAAGECWTCGKAPHPGALNPNDCRNFLLCSPTDASQCQD